VAQAHQDGEHDNSENNASLPKFDEYL